MQIYIEKRFLSSFMAVTAVVMAPNILVVTYLPTILHAPGSLVLVAASDHIRGGGPSTFGARNCNTDCEWPYRRNRVAGAVRGRSERPFLYPGNRLSSAFIGTGRVICPAPKSKY
jgi:hypothetical protein